MPIGFMYILECSNGTYYTGSTINLYKRLEEHQNGEGSRHTKKHLPIKLVYHGNLKEFMMLLKEKKKFKVGAEKRKKL